MPFEIWVNQGPKVMNRSEQDLKTINVSGLRSAYYWSNEAVLVSLPAISSLRNNNSFFRNTISSLRNYDSSLRNTISSLRNCFSSQRKYDSSLRNNISSLRNYLSSLWMGFLTRRWTLSSFRPIIGSAGHLMRCSVRAP